jgi:hypothetical protein
MINQVLNVLGEVINQEVRFRTGRTNNCVIRMERKFCPRSY